MKYLTEKVVIKRSQTVKGAFEVTFMRLEPVEEAISFSSGRVITRKVERWVRIGKIQTFRCWEQVQQYLNDNVYKDETFVQNLTDKHVNFNTIECSSVSKYMR